MVREPVRRVKLLQGALVFGHGAIVHPLADMDHLFVLHGMGRIRDGKGR